MDLGWRPLGAIKITKYTLLWSSTTYLHFCWLHVVVFRRTDNKTFQNDVALLKLVEPVALDQSGFINAVCLPTRSRSLPVGSVCLAAGWGKIRTYIFLPTLACPIH